MKYICSWSGGKDSCASVLLSHEYGEPLDYIIFSEVMYDLANNISGENPLHIDYIHKAKALFESWGYKVIILRSDKDYLSVFNHVIKNPRTHPEHAGMRYGFCLGGMCSIRRDCKVRPVEQFLESLGDDYVQYLGIAVDEPARLRSMHRDPHKVSLLEKYGFTESMARDLCEKYGLLSPTYTELSHINKFLVPRSQNRGGCWFCPYAKLSEHMYIKTHMPDVWQHYVSLEKADDLAYPRWNVYTSETLHERDALLDSMLNG